MHPPIAINAVTILNHPKISRNCLLSTLAAFKKRTKGEPLTDILPVRNPIIEPTTLYDNQESYISIFFVTKDNNDNRINKTPKT